MGYLLTQLSRFWENFILGIGAHLTISTAGIFFFGFPVCFSLAAYVVVISTKAGLSIWLAILLSLTSAAIAGLFFIALYRRLSSDSFAVFTLASILAFDALLKSWDSVTGGVLGISGIVRPWFASNLFQLMILQGVLAICLFVAEYFLLRSSFGRALGAHKENPRLLDAAGTSAKKVGSHAILIASVLSGLAGILTIWRIQFLDPNFGGLILFIIVLTIGILAIKPDSWWLAGVTLVVTMIPEILRFFPFPSSVLGYARILVYALFLIILVRRLSARYTGEKRLV